MRSSWFKWMLIVAVLLMSGSGGAHTVADHHAASKALPCAVHQHHHDGDHHLSHECCCSCSACPADLVLPAEPDAPHSVAYDLRLTPEPASPLASRFPSPELDPPRPAAVS